MIWKVFRVYFVLYLIPCMVMLTEQFSTQLGIDLTVVPVQYGYVVTALYIIGGLYLLGVCGSDFFSRSEHVALFGNKRKYSFVWTWILAVPAVVYFHKFELVACAVQFAVFLILEILRRRHNKLWDEDEKARIIQKAKDAKAERVEIDQ